MGTRTTDCRKFTPNIFNKSKCSHCFRQREEHSAAALECNRASRKVSKCGYLFVAPDWDFNNPLYRTKRWQRRWFVLYDDGELTYSVDEHPETVPQAVIDMTKVLEVTSAEDVTGHSNSIAITAPERVTFVKGTCPEESKWWLNILGAFPKSKGRHKRNATFPVGVPNNRNRLNPYHKDTLTSQTVVGSLDVIGSSWDNGTPHHHHLHHHLHHHDSVISSTGQDENNKNAGNELTNRVYTDQPVSSKSPPTRDKIHPDIKAQARIRNRNRTTPSSQQVQDDSEPASSCLLIEDARHDEKWKDIANALTNLSHMTATTNNRCWSQQSNVSATTTTSSSSLSSLTSMTNINNTTNSILANQSSTSMDDKPIDRDETDYHCNSNSYINNNNKNINSNSNNNNNNNNNNNSNNNTSHQDFRQIVNTRPKSLPLASNSTPAIVSAIVKKIPPVTLTNTDNNNKSSSGNNINKNNNNNNINKSSPKIKLNKFLFNKNKNNNQSQERGDPDGGCNLDDLASTYLSKTAELRVNLPPANEEILNLKKGWLLKQDPRTKEWTKHWFSLRGAALFYYRDPVTEERGVLDGVLDVNSLTNVSEFPSTSPNFGFQLTTWDNRRINLASISANARTNWINVLRNAAGLQSQSEPKPIAITDDTEPELIIKDNTSDDLKSEIEKDFIKAQRNQEIIINNLTIHEPESESPPTVSKSVPTPATPITTKTVLFSSDEEYRTASEGGRRDSVDWGSPLSPSPPISLSIFRAKERIRSRSGSSPRLHKRSRSSPPSSRRSTVDSIGSDELPLIHPVQEEFNIDKELQIRLGVAEKERDMLREEARERETRMSELLTTLERTELELTARIREVEEARDNLQRQLTEANSRAENVIARLTADLEGSQKKIKDFEDRLSRGIEENESLYKKLREMEGCSITNLNRSKMRRVDSLSDLTNLNEIDPYGLERDVLADEYNELKSRFEKAVSEIKAMKKELKESQNEFDSLEISYAALKQDLERKESEDRSQLQMMAERIQDLTLKYTASERQVRTLKQKLAKSERRRSSSLKGKEQVIIPKELEDKVIAMEGKIDDLEKLNQNEKFERCRSDSNSSSKKLSSQPRRKSLDSSGNTDSLQFMVRLNALDKRIENVSSTKSSLSTSNRKISEHLVERLKCLEGVLISSKDRIEQSLHQLHSLRSTRTRRSVSPITDRKDSLRFVERCLTEVIKLIRESCETCIVGENSNSTGVILLPESNPIKLALLQLEAQLRNKLGDLLKQRRVLKERNELSSRKNLELLAERIAFESVCFGKLKDSIDRAENPSLFGVKQTKAEIAETSQLMSTLKAKLGGKCAFKPSGSLDILAGVLARRLILSNYNSNNQQKMTELAPVDPKIMDELLRQQNEICLITKRYKNNAMETLAAGLAAETLSYISSNDSVQGAVQEAWRQAQETVNAELVQSEIANIMLKSAERFENAITPSFGYALTNEERVSFENFADAVHDSLRREMEIAIEQLTRKYQDSLQKMKRGQWRLHLEQERKASEGRQLLVEFADIMAHKALVDARIAVLKGEYVTQNPSGDQKLDFSVATLQKYENLFEELSNDLQICNPDDILTEADFNFMYKKYTIEFLSDKPHLREISAIFSKLEESIGLLHNALDSNSSIVISSVNFENMDDICQKCQELKQKVDNVVAFAQKLTSTCKHCEKMQESLCSLTAQHETELRNLEQMHAKEIISLRKQIEDQINIVKCLGNEKNSLIEELALQSNLVEDHEKELAAISLKLKNKEEECHRRDNENLDIMEKLEDQENQIKNIKEEKERLSNKCVRQDEEYAALLQERDYIQAELNKERERTRKLEKRLEMLEIEHSKQLECLQEAYKDQILSHCTDFTGITDEESFRQRYQTEIEQLRTLCEKGLAAMESSHRRIIADLEDKHRKEIERLLTEKEQALAEETQATLAALDAMRKAHQSEVQREVARFKQDFLKQFQKGEHCIDPVREKEEELEELRQEILSFSEKYSIKCVENAALEERLRAANQKLKQFQQMQQLELRNKQFRAHLASDNSSDLNFVQGLTSKEDSPCPDSEHADCCNEISAKNSNLCNEQTNNNNNDKYDSNNHHNYKKLYKEDDEENDVKVEVKDLNEDKDENNDKKHDEFDECINVKIKSKNDTNNEGMINMYRTFNDYNNINDNNMTNNMNQQINDQFNNNKITTTTTKELSHYENNNENKNKNVKSIELASKNHKNDSDNKNKNLSSSSMSSMLSSSSLSFSPSQLPPPPPPPTQITQQEFSSTSLSSSSSYFVNNKNLNKNINNNNNFNSYKKPVDEPKISKINTPKNFNSRCNLILKTNYNNNNNNNNDNNNKNENENNNNDSIYHDDNNKNCILTNVSNVETQYENSITTIIEQQHKQKFKHLIPNHHNNDQSNQINRYISRYNISNNDQHDQKHHSHQQQQIIANQSATKLNDFQNTVETTRPNRNEIIKKRLAISLSSLSELLNNSTNCMRNNNYHNMNNTNNSNNNNPNNPIQIRMKHHQHQQKHMKDDSNLKKNFITTTISNSDRNVVIDHLRPSLSLSSSSSSSSTNNNHNDNNNNNKNGDENEKYLINNSSIISSTSSSLSSLSSLSSTITPTLKTTTSSSLFKQHHQQQQQQQQQQHQQQQFHKNQQHKQTVQTSMLSNNNLSIMSPTSIPTSTTSTTSTTNPSSISINKLIKCSPPPLNGRDVEHHHHCTTSHLRRFELEI